MEKWRINRYLINFVKMIILLIMIPSFAQAQVPRTINYQGYLTDSGGTPINATVSMVFSLYALPSGGTSLWTETQGNVMVTDGVYSVVIGSVTPLDPSHFIDPLYLGVTVGTDAEMTPRQVLTSVGFALKADDADTLDGLDSAAFSGATHTHGGADITTGTVAEANIDTGIARDSEVTSLITTHTSDSAAHHARYTNAEAVTAIKAGDGPGSGVDADLLDSLDSSAFASNTHDHHTEYVKLDGYSTLSGNLRVEVPASSTSGIHIDSEHGINFGLSVLIKDYGEAARFTTLSTQWDLPTVYAQTLGGGPAIAAGTQGTGLAGHFQISNTWNDASALLARTDGSGAAVYGYTTGTGRAGHFEIINPANAKHALFAKTNGTGRAGYFDGGVQVTGALSAASISGDGSGITNIDPGSHTHSGDDITTGSVSAAYIDPAIARDAELTWANLSGIPADFDDDTDNDTTYIAGTGLSLTGTTFDVQFAGAGSANTAAKSDHEHDIRYYTETELQASGSSNVHWNNLTNRPAGLDDGDQDTTYSAGSGLSLAGTTFDVQFAGAGSAATAARSDHAHDTRYYTETELQTSGSSNVHWNNLTNRPAGLDDGDQDTLYGAGSGLTLVGTVFSANYSQVAPAIHNHDTHYVNVTGDTMSGNRSIAMLHVTNAYSGDVPAVYGKASSTGNVTNYGGSFEAAGESGRGVYGKASKTGDVTNYGGYFEAQGEFGRGVYGICSGTSIDATGSGVYGESAYGTGVHGTAVRSDGVRGYSTGGFNIAKNGVYGETDGSWTEIAGVKGVSTSTACGLYGSSSSGHAIRAKSEASGKHAGYFETSAGLTLDGAALYASNTNAAGISFWANNSSTEATAVFSNYGTGRLISAQQGATEVFAVDNNGKVIAPVVQITGGSDLSERFEIAGIGKDPSLSPGMVVSIDPDRPGDLVVSHQTYDRRVAGIISGAGGVKPGMLMGQRGSEADGASPVALSGRVYCWADTSNGAIGPGDLLTTSDRPGHAMKVTDYVKAQGAVIGKSMSRLETGKGLVLVLVSLQ